MKRLSAFLLVIILCFSVLSPSALAASSTRDISVEKQLATNLKDLGLFKGVSDTDFALDRAPTRTEAIVMLIRSLGKESEALGGSWSDPFTDVPEWAEQYIGYAYQKGLTNGISSTSFGTGYVSANMYITFVLRSLGYSDQGGDFFWDQPYSLARSINILPDRVQLTDFLRADAVTVTYLSLTATVKNSSQTLAEKLISDGAFTGEQYETYYEPDALSEDNTQTALTPVEIYAKCSPAVFYIEVYNSKGTQTGCASGFFLDSNGTAVTNYHVISGAYSAKITTSDTNTVYNVEGVYDYNKDEDWAIIKVKGSGFSYLDLADSSTVVGGETVYAIGNPLGLKDTISQGLISNPKRQVDEGGVTYIQTTAAISVGSSGGALLNEYGKVVGITSATSSTGQNINLAVPINLIKGYTATSCQSLLAITVNSRSALISYTGYSEIPDCGAFCGINVYKSFPTSNGVTYYYTTESLDLSNAWQDRSGYEYPKYLDILTDWGFTYATEFSVGSSYYWQFYYSSDSASYVVLVGTTKLNMTDCLMVQITKS